MTERSDVGHLLPRGGTGKILRRKLREEVGGS